MGFPLRAISPHLTFKLLISKDYPEVIGAHSVNFEPIFDPPPYKKFVNGLKYGLPKKSIWVGTI